MYRLTAVAAALSLPLFVASAPTGKMTKRDGITCNKTYGGALVAMNLYTNQANDIPKQTNIYKDDTGGLSASLNGQYPAMMVEFDTCTTEGWNPNLRTYGQVKPLDDYYTCLTILPSSDPSTDSSASLNFQPCASDNSTDGSLQNQWFEGQWDEQGGFHVIYSGDPYFSESLVRQNVEFAAEQIGPNNPIKVNPGVVNGGLTEFQFSGIQYF